MLRTLSVLVISAAVASAEFYQFHNAFGEGEKRVDTFDKRGGSKLPERKLQLDVGTLSSINATTDTCTGNGAELECYIDTVISADDGTSAQVEVQVTCNLESQTAFDFRRATGCSCGARVTHTNGNQKNCPCIVCPFGFGNAPISIDCTEDEDPFIISTCSYLDCGFACNGTCEFSCKNSGPSCSFCANNPNAPTLAPTGLGGTRPPSLIPSSKASVGASTFLASGLLLVAATLQLVSL
uniref:GPI anchored protein n=1 Tax=Entomoneis paludosa TaxID=265537 RepID=A0A7S2YDH6_9STRA|mmetsp:Transcript_27845/g.58305  ORF Transcript_27845/g.58305 Transcript_27845/m.58305 type:complete len:239 (+) Transcript_27845:81-797(+)